MEGDFRGGAEQRLPVNYSPTMFNIPPVFKSPAIGRRLSRIWRPSKQSSPGGYFDIGDMSGHHEHALLTWVLVQANGTVFAKGHDQIRVFQEGKIVSLITFPSSTSNP
jgi:hypothetical protein